MEAIPSLEMFHRLIGPHLVADAADVADALQEASGKCRRRSSYTVLDSSTLRLQLFLRIQSKGLNFCRVRPARANAGKDDQTQCFS
jgi:hypothetical protein